MTSPFLTWITVTLGLTYIVTQSTIFSVLRRALAKVHPFLKTLVYCPACFGFWAGAGAAWCSFEISELSAVLGGLNGMLLGALWSRWGPEVDVWSAEQVNDGKKTEETENE